MFSLEHCREILGVNDLDDLELQQLRDQLYGLAEVITDEIKTFSTDDEREIQENHPIHNNGFETALRILEPAEREEVEERAAIIEFEGRDNRDEAERKAVLIALGKRHETK
jgi:hypothetical protein